MCRSAFHGEVEFLTTATWAGGMAIIRDQVIDVLLLDLVLLRDVPPMTREDTLRALVSTPDLPPVVVLSGASDDKFLPDKCILAGADSFMYKKDANHRPEQLCEKVYFAYMRRQRDLRKNETRA